MNNISHFDWCKTQPCSKLKCSSEKICKAAWNGAMELMSNKQPGQEFYFVSSGQFRLLTSEEAVECESKPQKLSISPGLFVYAVVVITILVLLLRC